MKNKSFLLFLAFVLCVATGFSQEPVMNPDSIPDYSTVKGIVPDCDLWGVAPFRTYLRGKWVNTEHAPYCYSLVWGATKEVGDNPSPEDAVRSIDSSLTNPVVKRVWGHIAAISYNKKTKEWCVSFNDKLEQFDGRFWCRLNSEWSLWTRDGCGNPCLVYDPIKKDTDPKEAFKTDPLPQKCQEVNFTIINNLQVSKVAAPLCCEIPKYKWLMWYGMLGSRSTYSTDLIPENFFFGVGVRQHWRDSTMMGSTYVGSELSLMMRGKNPDCPDGNCLNFSDENLFRPAMRWEVFLGREFSFPGFTRLRGFAQVNYALIQPQGLEKDRVFLPKKSGLSLSGGVRWEPFDGIEVSGGPEYDIPSNQFGGQVKLTVSFATIGEANKQVKEKQSRNAKAKQQEELIRDSVAVSSFLAGNPKPIVIDSVSLAPDTTIRAMRLPFTSAPMPFTKGAKEVRIENQKVKVLELQIERNNDLETLKQNRSMTALEKFQETENDLERAERKLERLEKKNTLKPETE